MVRAVGLVTIGLLLVLVLRWAIRDIRRIAATRPRQTSADSSGYEWERRKDQYSRRIKGISFPTEDRRKILDFLESRDGVEAFVEPRTAVSGLSVVLVAGDGEWMRVPLRDDAFLRELTRSRGLRVYDAGKTGYPERMRRYRPDDGRPSEDPD